MKREEWLLPLLSAVCGEEKARQYAEILRQRYPADDSLTEADAQDLFALGLPTNAVLALKLTTALASRRVTEGFRFGARHSEEEIRDFLAATFFGKGIETVCALILDRDDRVLTAELMSSGTVSYSSVHPRSFIEKTLRHGGEKIIVAHNHPSGNAVASELDVTSTRDLAHLLREAGIELVAHYVVANGQVAKIEFEEENYYF